MASVAQTKVYLFSENTKVALKRKKALKEFIKAIFKREKTQLASITYIFTTDNAVLKINQQYLDHNYHTDIITFDLSEPGKPVVADVYMSIDRIRDNSKLLGVKFNYELHRVIFHGALHLCGYRDKLKSEKHLMRKMEDYYLSKYFG